MKMSFTIGPVQGFVRQSRRTRDLWASSFLLSYLSGCAMVGAARHGRILLPDVSHDPLYLQLLHGSSDNGIQVGSLPNRFLLETDDPESAAKSALESFRERWDRIGAIVWERYVAGVADLGRDTQEIFERQVHHFWEIQWVAAGDDEELRGLLERRKEWRSRIPTVEGGDKCSVMPELQELSGHVRAGGDVPRTKQDGFWGALKARGRLHDAELRPGERLSAVALIKRTYPRDDVAGDALGWDPGAVRWRSTVYVAAIPWIDEVLERAPALCREYGDAVHRHDERARREIPARTVRSRHRDSGGSFARLDANYFFTNALANAHATFAGLPETGEGSGVRKDMARRLVELYRAGGADPVGPPASFYALLLMDGDRVGALLRRGAAVSQALGAFTKQVSPIVAKHQGYAIYSGGDDVLAMLPVPRALECAWKLRDAYRGSFDAADGATTSAAVVFAHVRRPLGQVLAEAHHLLDDVAKDRNGRDSIAVSLLRHGDRTLEWASTWDEPGGDLPRLTALHDLRDMWRERARRRRAGEENPPRSEEISTGLVYRVRELMGMLCGWPRWEPGADHRFSPVGVKELLAAEVRRAWRSAGLHEEDDGAASAEQRDSDIQRQAEAMAGRLLHVGHPARRDPSGQSYLDETRFGMGGPLLALFLSTDGKERDHGVEEGS